jgi:hypothetical protein
MTKAELAKVFGARLRPKPDDEGIMYLDGLQPLCGGNFQVTFLFDKFKPKRGLTSVDLELEKPSNADGKVGDCVMAHYAAKFGRPKFREQSYYFAGERVILYITPARIRILNPGHGCRFWEFNCRQDFGG